MRKKSPTGNVARLRPRGAPKTAQPQSALAAAATVVAAATPAIALPPPVPWHIRHRAELRFVVTFAAIAGVLFALYSFPYAEGSAARRWSDGYLRAYAHMAGSVLSLFEHKVHVSGQDIIGRYSVRIVRGCDAIDAQILLVSAVVASSAYSWRRRATGAVLGFLLVTVVNVARICSLYYIGALLPSYFDFFHHEFWPLLLIVVAIAAFIAWSRMGIARAGVAHATG
jgi:exosortase/archaeosortase family protein